ncbi:hypothetical protein D3C86_1331460 [compost metagenome]
MQHFILQGIFFSFFQLAALFGLELENFRFQRLLHDGRRQDFLFLARAKNDLPISRGVGQSIALGTHRGNPAGFCHILATAWGKGVGG